MAVQPQVTQNKETSRRVFEEVVNQRNFALAEELVAESYKHHDAITGDVTTGKSELRKAIEEFSGGFSDGKMTILDQIADGDSVATRLRMEGTHDGALGPLEATGKRVDIEGIVEHRYMDGKIVETFPQWDMLGMMRQIGVVPDGPSA